MIITCVIMLVLSFRQSAQMRGLQKEITDRQAWIDKNSHIENHEFFQDLKKRADAELKNQAVKPDFFCLSFLQFP